MRFGGKRWGAALLLGVLATGALLVGCGSSDEEEEPTSSGTKTEATSSASTKATATAKSGIDYSALAGEIRIDGSSTVFPISEAVAEEFSKVAKTRVNVAFSGTGGGFEKFCRGELQFSDASRAIKDSEKKACADNNINDIVELQVAIDALTVMVHPQNNWVTCLTVPELQKMFSANGPTNWKDVRPEFPDRPIKFYYPGADSGTFDYFKEAIIGTTNQHRGDGTASEDDNVLAQGIENDQNAIGYFGFAYFLEAGSKLKAVQVDGGKGCVTPKFEAALDGTYAPLSRALYIYTRESLLKEKAEVRGFAKFYLDNTTELSKEVGYISMPADLLAKQQAKIQPFLVTTQTGPAPVEVAGAR